MKENKKTNKTTTKKIIKKSIFLIGKKYLFKLVLLAQVVMGTASGG
jgi:hypothetical protein